MAEDKYKVKITDPVLLDALAVRERLPQHTIMVPAMILAESSNTSAFLSSVLLKAKLDDLVKDSKGAVCYIVLAGKHVRLTVEEID